MAYNVYDSPYDPSTGGITAAIPYPGTVVEPMPPVTYNPGTTPEPAYPGLVYQDGFWYDPATNQWYDSGYQKIDDPNVMPHPGSETTTGAGGLPGRYPTEPGDGGGSGAGGISGAGGLPGRVDYTPNPNAGPGYMGGGLPGRVSGGVPVDYTPTPMPSIPGGTPNVDPYDIGSSPDVSGWMDLEGISPVNPQADPFQYGEVSDFSDAAFAQAMRYLDPQFALEDRRFEQNLINKGLDPNSEAGIESLRRKEMGQSDLLSRAAFDALGFGTDLQNQMFGQAATRSGLSQELLQALMGLQQRGHEFDTAAGLNANQQAFAQMLALEGLDYRDYQTLIDQLRYDDSLALALLGLGGPPQYNTISTGFASAPAYDLQGALDMWNTPLFGGG